MTRFIDGPAEGVTLMLKRAPLFLRVVVRPIAQVDALDATDDEPEAAEAIFAYVRVGQAGTVHIDGRDKRGRRFGEWYSTAEYKLWPTQPADDVMRIRSRWQAWAVEQVDGQAQIELSPASQP